MAKPSPLRRLGSALASRSRMAQQCSDETTTTKKLSPRRPRPVLSKLFHRKGADATQPQPEEEHSFSDSTSHASSFSSGTLRSTSCRNLFETTPATSTSSSLSRGGRPTLLKTKQTKHANLPDHGYFSSNHVLINRARAKAGLGVLYRQGVLDELARAKAEQLAEMDQLKRTPRAQLVQKCNSVVCAENVLLGPSIRAMHSLMESKLPRHKANMLSEQFNEMGMATAKSANGTLYMVQYFRYNPERRQ